MEGGKAMKSKKRLVLLIITLALTLIVLFVYRLFLVPDTPLYRYYPYVMWVYMIILTVFFSSLHSDGSISTVTPFRENARL